MQQQDFVERVIQEEEEAFLRTLDKGIRIFNEYIENGADAETRIEWHAAKRISGAFAFKLNDTYGFPDRSHFTDGQGNRLDGR